MIAYHFRKAKIADAPYLARILIEANQATFNGLVPKKRLTSFTVEQSTANWQRTLAPKGLKNGQFLIVAENEQAEIVGYALAQNKTQENDFDSELNVLMIDTPWQRKGIGRALMVQVAKKLHKQGSQTMIVGVLAENPNCQFYERLGGQQVGARPYDWDGHQTTEVLYGWINLQDLIDQEVGI